MALGTLNVACISADGLERAKSGRMIMDVKPKCSISVSDISDNIYNRDEQDPNAKPKSHEDLRVAQRFTSSAQSGTEPSWEEGFSYQARCPHMRDIFFLDVAVIDSGMMMDGTLGVASHPIMLLLKRELAEKDHKLTLKLEPGLVWRESRWVWSSDDVGSIKLRTKWCPLGPRYEQCMSDFASGGIAMKGEALLDCAQSCYSGLVKTLQYIDQTILRARRLSTSADEQSSATEAWDQVVQMVDEFPTLPEATCGESLASVVAGATAKLHGPVKGFEDSASEAKRLQAIIKDIVREVEGAKKDMDAEILEHARMVPDLIDQWIPGGCQEAFRGKM